MSPRRNSLKHDYFPLKGGWDQITSPLKLNPGRIIAGQNYEIGLKDGYYRVDGYERFDGQTAPSSSTVPATQESLRDDITTVPGTGNVHGVVMYEGNVYAFRNNSGQTACVMHKSSGSGWTEVDLGHELNFDAGTNEPSIGDTLTGGASGATATIKAIHLESGGWGTNDAAGHFYLDSLSGNYQNNEQLKVGVTLTADADGAESVWTISPNTSFKFLIHNFGGFDQGITPYLYFTTTADHAMFYDGTTVKPINTGMTTDFPHCIEAHKGRLFLAYDGGSLQYSGVGDLTDWTAVDVTDAGEIRLGEEITSILSFKENYLVIWLRNSTKVLVGATPTGFDLQIVSRKTGAIADTLAVLHQPVYLDDRGVATLAAVQEFGDVQDAIISKYVQPYINSRINNVNAVTISREKSQYRLFFDDKSGLTFTFRDNRLVGTTKFIYPDEITCAWSGEDSSGNERIFAGSDAGYVFEIDSGYNFDGVEVSAWVKLPFYHYKTPRYHKRFIKILAELDPGTAADTTLSYSLEYDYGSSLSAVQGGVNSKSIDGGGALWGEGVWGTFVWGAQIVGEMAAYVKGVGKNMSVLLKSEQTYVAPHTIHGLVVDYELNGWRR